MDIRSDGPLWQLSNFASWPFVLDGVRCAGMEGFLQSLKASDEAEQARIAGMVGVHAKRCGRRIAWAANPHPWWQGRLLDRLGPEYQRLLDRAYYTLVRANPGFCRALLATGDTPLTHSIGKRDPLRTILTEDEFINRLVRIRTWLRAQHP